MAKATNSLKSKLTNWMKNHLINAEVEGWNELINMYGIGEVNATRLAEEALYDSGLIDDLDAALNDDTHIVWDAAIDASEWFENRGEE